MSNGMKTAGKVLCWILAVLLLLGIVGVIVYFVAKEQGVTYYVEYGGEKYYANTEGSSFWLEPGETFSFKVQTLEGEIADYAVTVTSNPETNFEFTAGGKLYVWHGSSEKDNDYTELFKPEKAEDGFTLTAPQKAMVQDALEWKYGGEIELSGDLPQDNYFLLTITVSDSSVIFPFHADPIRVELNSTNIVF